MPCTGSPPMPTVVDWPRPWAVICLTTSLVNEAERDTTPMLPAPRAIRRHHSDLAHVRRQHALRVGADEAGARAAQRLADADHVEHGDAFGHRHHERHLGLDRLDHRARGTVGRNENDAGIGARLPHRLRHAVEHRHVEMGLASLLRA